MNRNQKEATLYVVVSILTLTTIILTAIILEN
jgi:hypothetical protein